MRPRTARRPCHPAHQQRAAQTQPSVPQNGARASRTRRSAAAAAFLRNLLQPRGGGAAITASDTRTIGSLTDVSPMGIGAPPPHARARWFAVVLRTHHARWFAVVLRIRLACPPLRLLLGSRCECPPIEASTLPPHSAPLCGVLRAGVATAQAPGPGETSSSGAHPSPRHVTLASCNNAPH